MSGPVVVVRSAHDIEFVAAAALFGVNSVAGSMPASTELATTEPLCVRLLQLG